MRTVLWSHTPCTLIAWYPFLPTYSGYGCVPSTHFKVFGMLNSEKSLVLPPIVLRALWGIWCYDWQVATKFLGFFLIAIKFCILMIFDINCWLNLDISPVSCWSSVFYCWFNKNKTSSCALGVLWTINAESFNSIQINYISVYHISSLFMLPSNTKYLATIISEFQIFVATTATI